MKYKKLKRMKGPACTPVDDWIAAYTDRKNSRPTMLGAVSVFNRRACAMAMVRGVVLAAPLDCGVLPQFRDELPPEHREVYENWVAQFQAGDIENPPGQVLNF